mgnify:CR=1 FL=1
MSKLKAFLQPPITGKTKEVVVSDRFVDENGTIQPFVIQAISQEKNADGIPMPMLDNGLYTKRLMLECVKEPDLNDSELCKYYGVIDPLEVLGRMLSIGEYQNLSAEIMGINGLKTKKEKLEEAKNS